MNTLFFNCILHEHFFTLYPGLEEKKKKGHAASHSHTREPGPGGSRDVGSRTQSLIAMFPLVALTPYKALLPDALLTPPYPPRSPRAHPTPGVADTASERKRKGKETVGATENRTTQVQVGDRSPRGSRGRAPGRLAPTSADTRAPQPVHNLLARRGPDRPSPGSSPRARLPAPGRWRRRGPTGRLGSRGAGPRPGRLPGLSPRPRVQSWPRSSYLVRPFGRQQWPPARLSLAHSLAPSLGRAAAQSRLRRVPARG